MSRLPKTILAFVLLFSIPTVSVSQCGIAPVINLSGVSPSLTFDAYSSVQQANWVIYNYQWEMNGQVASNQASFTPNMIYAVTLDKVCLTIWGTNPVTQDSCSATRCNIFEIEEYIPLTQINAILTNGNQVSIPVSYYGSGNPPYQIQVDFGDGNQQGYTNPDTIQHTYSNSGTKNIAFTDFMVPGPSVTATAHINNGQSNFSSINTQVSVNGCDSAYFFATTNPPMASGQVDWYSYPVIYTYLTNSIGSLVKFNVPGCYMIRFILNDSVGGHVESLRHVIINDCNIIPDTISGTVWNDIDADGIWDAGENGLPNKNVLVGNYSSTTNANGYYEILVPHSYQSLTLQTASGNTITYPGNYGYNFNFTTNNPMHTNYNFGVASFVANINGTVFIDYNNDSLYNAGDVTVANATISAYDTVNQLTYFAVTDNYGNYSVDVPAGSFTLKVAEARLDSITIYPDSIFITNPVGSIYNKSFALQTNGSDLGVHLSASGQARPGFSYSVTATVENHRTDSCQAIIVMTYPLGNTYVSAQPAGAIHNGVNRTVTWTTGIIAPAKAEYFTGNFTVSVGVPLGTVLTTAAAITPIGGCADVNTTNNSLTLSSTVVGSLDPNDKSVAPAGTIAKDQRLYYRINFQNTGTASAINVIVQDVIDASLDLNTFLMERSSDNYELATNGNTFTWKFFNINLPDSNTNEPQSHGFIEYSIKPKTGLPDGTIINNTADIYFDFNPAVVTNITTNQIDLSFATQDHSNNRCEGLFPNPANQFIYFSCIEKQLAGARVTIYTLTGQMVYSDDLKDDHMVPVASFSPGLYFIKIDSGNFIYRSRFIKE